MYIHYCSIFILSLFVILNQAQQEGGSSLTPTPTPTSFTSFNNNTVKDEDYSTIVTNGNNVSATVGSITLSLPFSPSPTTFVFTHFPVPINTGSSSSVMSSARPSQSAPFPDDTIGKYGRLHISGASVLNLSSYFYFLILIMFSAFIFI